MQHKSAFPTRPRRPSQSFRRLRRTPVLRIILLFLLLWDTLHALSFHNAQYTARHAPPPRANTKRIYIAAQHWNSAHLLRQHWSPALVALVQQLGAHNVFVAIYESGSYDDTKEALQELDVELEALGVRRSVVLSEVSHADEMAGPPGSKEEGEKEKREGWVWPGGPDGEARLRRIPFLARTRNRVFEPLERMVRQGEQPFDTILFLNDVVFTSDDVLRLLDTNGGDYAAACSMDYAKPPQFYDTFALRDSRGRAAVMQTWPFFRAGESRDAVMRWQPVPVRSCWNGMVAMPIQPFISTTTPPLRFRAISDSLADAHVEASECCLIHADNKPLSPSSPPPAIFLNPNVKVAYNGSSYRDITSPDAVMSLLDIFAAMWSNRLRSWATTTVFADWKVNERVKRWMAATGASEPGAFCLVDEMQILFGHGWRHV